MSEEECTTCTNEQPDTDDENETFPKPQSKTLDELVKADEEDESLRKYKEMLLGEAVAGSGKVVVDENDARSLILKKLYLVVEGRPDLPMDLTQDLDTIKQKKFTLKEGTKFRIKFEFIVQRELVTGLKYVHKAHKGVMTEKMKQMVGSFPPRKEPYITETEEIDAPSGMLFRGAYTVSSCFKDDDTEHLKWEWSIDVKREWDD